MCSRFERNFDTVELWAVPPACPKERKAAVDIVDVAAFALTALERGDLKPFHRCDESEDDVPEAVKYADEYFSREKDDDLACTSP